MTLWVWTEGVSAKTTEFWLQDWEMGRPALRGVSVSRFVSLAPQPLRRPTAASSLREEGPSALTGGSEVPRGQNKPV